MTLTAVDATGEGTLHPADLRKTDAGRGWRDIKPYNEALPGVMETALLVPNPDPTLAVSHGPTDAGSVGAYP